MPIKIKRSPELQRRVLERVAAAREGLGASTPWRCTKCHTAVVPGRGDPCKCGTLPSKKKV